MKYCLYVIPILKRVLFLNSIKFENCGDLASSGINNERKECLFAKTEAILHATPLLLEVYATSPHESRDPNQPIANFRCSSVAPEEARFSELPLLKSLSDEVRREVGEAFVDACTEISANGNVLAVGNSISRDDGTSVFLNSQIASLDRSGTATVNSASSS
ncbi:hypothetical protein WN51_01409 [Melipona quadrifasciata]|uniref:Uncharacterized protein n=1 Tax=Melipona quadrifasciata TaxID=166423 RepID=A0A0N0BER9_9HYME|nr:hypothetical protein WN51_01409 [Melipona quadrifasciata]